MEKSWIKFARLRAKTYSYLIDDGNDDKKQKEKKCVMKRKLVFEYCKNCLEATQLDDKINYLEKSKINVDSFFCYKRTDKEFIKNNILIL